MTAYSKKSKWLEINWLLSAYHSNRKQAIQADIRFVTEGKRVPSPLEGRKNKLILVNDEFIKINLAKLDLPTNLAEYSRAERRQLPRPIAWYFVNASNRNEVIAMAYESGRYTMKEIGDSIGLGYSMVSRIIKNSRFKT